MKKFLCSRLLRISFVAVATIGFGRLIVAAEKKEARVTQVIRDVRLLAAHAGPRPASVNDSVREGTAVRTGGDSRAELTFTDQTLTRLGANTIFSFSEGARDFDLTSGAVLLCVPKGAGSIKVNTPAVSAAVTGGIAMVESHTKSWIKFIILEGDGRICLKKYPSECQQLHAGQIIIFRPNAQTLPEVHDVDLKKLTNGLLFTQFHKLPAWAWNLISIEIENQQSPPPAGGFIDPTSQDTRDQKAAATEQRPAPTPRHREPSPGESPPGRGKP
jgi:hypothetical protein